MGACLTGGPNKACLKDSTSDERPKPSRRKSAKEIETEHEDLFSNLQERLDRPVNKTPTKKDWPRLARRMHMFCIPDGHVSLPTEPSEASPSVDSTARQLGALLAEGPNVRHAILSLATSSPNADREKSEYAAMLIDELGGQNSRVVRALKCTHQSVLMCGIAKLRYGPLKGISIRDSRDGDGWNIDLTADHSEKGWLTFTVVHRRKELLVKPSGETFGSVCWQLELEFRDPAPWGKSLGSDQKEDETPLPVKSEDGSPTVPPPVDVGAYSAGSEAGCITTLRAARAGFSRIECDSEEDEKELRARLGDLYPPNNSNLRWFARTENPACSVGTERSNFVTP